MNSVNTDKNASVLKAERAARKRLKKRERDLSVEALRKERAVKAEEEKKLRLRELAHKKAENEKRRKEASELREKRRTERKKLAEERAELSGKKRKARLEARQAVYRKVRKCLKNDPSGFDYFNYGVLPRVILRVKGDGASVAARLSASGIAVRDLVESGAYCRFKIRKKDIRKAIAIFDDMCYTYEVCGYCGIGRFLTFWRARLGILIGAVAVTVALNISYSYVWRIEISGNELITEAAISRVLYDAGIRGGVKKRTLSLSGVTAAVNGIDGVSDASAEVVGTTLFVYVLEASDYEFGKEYAAYGSAYDATVTRIVMRSGTARVAIGDIVKSGEILADGNVYSTLGELLYTGACDADIYGNVTVAVSCELSKSAVEYRATGRTDVKTDFTLFGRKIFKAKSPYASYEVKSETFRYDVLLPLYVTRYEYAETKPVTVERDIDAAVKEFAEREKERLKFTGEFDYSYTVVPTVAELYRVNVFLSGEALISRGIEQLHEQ